MLQTIRVNQAELNAYLASLPVDDEPTTDHEREALAEHQANPGDVLTSEQLRAELEIQ